MEPNQISCSSGHHLICITFHQGTIKIKAYSETDGTLFVGELTDETMPESLKTTLKDCETVYEFMRESVAEETNPELSDNGMLKFTYVITKGKKELKKEFSIELKKQQVSETEKIAIKLEKYE